VAKAARWARFASGSEPLRRGETSGRATSLPPQSGKPWWLWLRSRPGMTDEVAEALLPGGETAGKGPLAPRVRARPRWLRWPQPAQLLRATSFFVLLHAGHGGAEVLCSGSGMGAAKGSTAAGAAAAALFWFAGPGTFPLLRSVHDGRISGGIGRGHDASGSQSDLLLVRSFLLEVGKLGLLARCGFRGRRDLCSGSHFGLQPNLHHLGIARWVEL